MKTECVLFETAQIRSLFFMIAAVASGRSSDDMLRANAAGEVIDIDYDRITDERFFAIMALIAIEHGMHLDRTKSYTKEKFDEALDAAYAAVLQG